MSRDTNSVRIIEYNQQYKVQRGLDPNILMQSKNATLRDKAKDIMAQVKKRDKFTCQLCRKQGGYLNTHHIIPITKQPELFANEDNLITLCKECHKLAHNNNTHGPINEDIQKILIRIIKNIAK